MLHRLKKKWALVTGASEGIGREFCRQLSEAKINLVLVARRQHVLEELAQTLSESHGVLCQPMPSDLSNPENALQLAQELESRHICISLLVNNAGIGQWGRFEQVEGQSLRNTIAVNIQAATMLCHAFYGQLKQQAPNAAVINVSSQAALQPVPFMAVYGASKAFLHSFSLALYEEWKEEGIYVQTLIPGPTQTGFDSKAGAYESKISRRDPPEKVVRMSLAALQPDQPVVASVRGIFLQRMFAGLFPPGMVTRKVAKMFRPPEKK